MSTVMPVSRSQAVAFRLRVNHLTERLPARAYDQAARFALQDSAPRSALVSLHARVADCEPDAWEDERLAQTYSPRGAVHVFPVADWAVFTLGRLPGDPDERRAIDEEAKRAMDVLGPGEHRSTDLPQGFGHVLRHTAASGRIAVRWDTTMVWFRAAPPLDMEFEEARLELCRRHVHAYGPTTPAVFAWWAGIQRVSDVKRTWQRLADEIVEVNLEGRRAWILASDEPALATAAPPQGVRLLPAEDGKFFGPDKAGLFAGPQVLVNWSTADTHHAHHLVVNGELAGRWGRRAGRVVVKVDPDVYASAGATLFESIEAEALSMPIPNAEMRVEIVEGSKRLR